MKTATAENSIWDVAVVGGGPAGMMAAGTAAARGAKVILLEKNSSVGKKLLITGGGRCNVTNAEEDMRVLLAKFKDSDKFLFSAFSQWGVAETLAFFHEHQMETKVEANKRVFPITDKAQSVWNVLVAYMKERNVTVHTSAPVVRFVHDGEKIFAVELKDKSQIRAHSFILATGGKSRPETGSTGDGFKWLVDMKHTVHESDAALVPLAVEDAWIKELAGVSVQNIKLTVFQNKAKQDMRKGNLLFTHVGISGPTVLNMSRDVGELLKYGSVELELDLLPTLSYDALNARLQEVFTANSNKKLKNSLNELLPSALVSPLLKLSGIDADVVCNSVTRPQRLALLKLIKHIPLQVKGLLGLDKAVVTSGGVDLAEVDFRTMRSRLISNLYLVGDTLNIDRPSGGYSLQLCWTTGHVAGEHAANSK